MRLPRILETTLAVGRTRVESQVVNWTPEFIGFGNQLYLWCWAHERRHHRPSHKVLITAKMRPWLAFVPEFRRQFLVERDEVGLFDSRDHFWAHKTRNRGTSRASRARADLSSSARCTGNPCHRRSAASLARGDLPFLASALPWEEA